MAGTITQTDGEPHPAGARFLRIILIGAIVAAGGVLSPFLRNASIIAILLPLLVTVIVLFRVAGGRLTRVVLTRAPAAGVILVSAAALVFTVGSLEYLARLLADWHIVGSYHAMETQLPPGTEDWRMAHLTADLFRQPDPVLWWRPVSHAPYNSQGFKGPEIAPNDRSTLRVVVYGDSNTDGPDSGGWVEQLGTRVAAATPRAEVLNAGVAGYSSHQGVRRFEGDVALLGPDVVLVSFGWNDVANTHGPADAAFVPPPSLVAHAQRLLLRYKFYLTLLNVLRPSQPAPAAVSRPRVSVDEYVANMERFARLAAAHRVRLVFLTRPHRPSVQEMRANSANWRSSVPDYNEALRRYASASGVKLIDVQTFFDGSVADFIDECHFNPAGHKRMADLVHRQLAQWAMVE